MAYGYDSAFIGTTITQTSFKRDFGLNEMTDSEQNSVNSNLTSICKSTSIGTNKSHVLKLTEEPDSAGGFFGALFMFFSLEQLGRKWTVIISDAIFAVGAILCTVATNQLGLMYAGRLLTGLGVGGIAAVRVQ